MDVQQRPSAPVQQNNAMNDVPNPTIIKSPQERPPSPALIPSGPAPSELVKEPRLSQLDGAAEAEATLAPSHPPPSQKEAGALAPRSAQNPHDHDPSQTPQAPIPSQTSHLSTNLISVMGLDSLAATVARTDSLTGEKINKMRKSYEGQIKTLGLAGKNKSIKHEEAVASGAKGMMSLAEMSQWPEEEWQNQKVHGKNVQQGLSEAIKGKLESAFQLLPGPVPEGNKWEDILGISDRPNPNSAAGKPRKDAKVNGKAVENAAPSAGPTNGATGEPIRARRNTKKRRYDDGSFEGYGEGFVDDEMDLEGYESGETYTSKNSRGSKGDKKRRKTKDFSSSPVGGHGGNSRTPSFNTYGGR